MGLISPGSAVRSRPALNLPLRKTVNYFLLVFIPLFVAIDPVGNISIFMALTQGYSRDEKQRLALQAVVTAFVVGITFGFGGHVIFRVLGITPPDFQIAGGIL